MSPSMDFLPAFATTVTIKDKYFVTLLAWTLDNVHLLVMFWMRVVARRYHMFITFVSQSARMVN
ncbi:hypothetical protein M433DRAFT_154554 [Acidomyces richmondensis BFW]|nr:MAG: hypothetical protein FE78DRAFT_90660 [Acidomyces sp. 'richmondensis']KYG45408.1 hypothetical protein M433DRAFT_154554 [Acidomyces richmondensis BFW]